MDGFSSKQPTIENSLQFYSNNLNRSDASWHLYIRSFAARSTRTYRFTLNNPKVGLNIIHLQTDQITCFYSGFLRRADSHLVNESRFSENLKLMKSTDILDKQ